MVGRFADVRRRSGQADADRRHRQSSLLSWSLMLSQAHGIGDARLLRPRRSRSHPVVAGAAAPAVRGAHRRHRRCRSIAMALLLAAPFINVLVVARRPALARRLRRRRRHGRRGDGAGGRAHRRAVPPDRPEAHAARRADRRRRHRRRLRHRRCRSRAILSYGTLSRIAVPDVGRRAGAGARASTASLWWPARAMLGDGAALAGRAGRRARSCSAASSRFFAPRFARSRRSPPPASASGAARQRARTARFRRGSPAQALRRKEWMLLRRDPWLMSQTLMQLLYLVPPALLLWRNFSGGIGALVLLVARCWSWRRASSPAASPGSRSRARTRPTSSRRRRSPPRP